MNDEPLVNKEDQDELNSQNSIEDSFVGVGEASVEHLDKAQKERYNQVVEHSFMMAKRTRAGKHIRASIRDSHLKKYKFFIIHGAPKKSV